MLNEEEFKIVADYMRANKINFPNEEVKKNALAEYRSRQQSSSSEMPHTTLKETVVSGKKAPAPVSKSLPKETRSDSEIFAELLDTFSSGIKTGRKLLTYNWDSLGDTKVDSKGKLFGDLPGDVKPGEKRNEGAIQNFINEGFGITAAIAPFSVSYKTAGGAAAKTGLELVKKAGLVGSVGGLSRLIDGIVEDSEISDSTAKKAGTEFIATSALDLLFSGLGRGAVKSGELIKKGGRKIFANESAKETLAKIKLAIANGKDILEGQKENLKDVRIPISEKSSRLQEKISSEIAKTKESIQPIKLASKEKQESIKSALSEFKGYLDNEFSLLSDKTKKVLEEGKIDYSKIKKGTEMINLDLRKSAATLGDAANVIVKKIFKPYFDEQYTKVLKTPEVSQKVISGAEPIIADVVSALRDIKSDSKDVLKRTFEGVASEYDDLPEAAKGIIEYFSKGKATEDAVPEAVIKSLDSLGVQGAKRQEMIEKYMQASTGLIPDSDLTLEVGDFLARSLNKAGMKMQKSSTSSELGTKFVEAAGKLKDLMGEQVEEYGAVNKLYRDYIDVKDLAKSRLGEVGTEAFGDVRSPASKRILTSVKERASEMTKYGMDISESIGDEFDAVTALEKQATLLDQMGKVEDAELIRGNIKGMFNKFREKTNLEKLASNAIRTLESLEKEAVKSGAELTESASKKADFLASRLGTVKKAEESLIKKAEAPISEQIKSTKSRIETLSKRKDAIAEVLRKTDNGMAWANFFSLQMAIQTLDLIGLPKQATNALRGVSTIGYMSYYYPQTLHATYKSGKAIEAVLESARKKIPGLKEKQVFDAMSKKVINGIKTGFAKGYVESEPNKNELE